MFDRSRTRFHDNNLQKRGATFHCAFSKIFDRVKSVALWSANIRKLTKDHKGYGSAAILTYTWRCENITVSPCVTVSDFLSVVGEKFFNDYLRIDTKRFPISVK